MSDERKVSGVDVRVRKLSGPFNPEQVLEITVGEGWDSVATEYLTLPQVCELISLLAQALPPEANPPLREVWLDRRSYPFNLPGTVYPIRMDDV